MLFDFPHSKVCSSGTTVSLSYIARGNSEWEKAFEHRLGELRYFQINECREPEHLPLCSEKLVSIPPIILVN